MAKEGEAEEDDPYEVLLEHASRTWAAGEENARRYATRANLLSTAILALLGLGITKLGQDLSAVSSAVWIFVIRTCLFVGALVLCLALLYMLGLLRAEPREELSKGTANHGLRLFAWFSRPVRYIGEKIPASIGRYLRKLPACARGLSKWLFGERRKYRADAASTMAEIAAALKGLAEVPEGGTKEYVRYQIFLSTMGAAVDLQQQNSLVRRRIDIGQQWLIIGILALAISLLCYTYAAGD